MGGATKNKALQPLMIYHHTSTLCTNLIWMAGAIEVEGKQEAPEHPQLGKVETDLRFRRACKDFPPVAWFTSEISVPRCLIQTSLFLKRQDTGEVVEIPLDAKIANAIALLRMALGFRVEEIPVIAWPEHYGYATPEGALLNETARDCGDDPDRWFVAEERINIDKMCEVRVAKSRQDLKMIRRDDYLAKLKPMLAQLKMEKAYVPPAWLSLKDAEALAASLGLKIKNSF